MGSQLSGVFRKIRVNLRVTGLPATTDVAMGPVVARPPDRHELQQPSDLQLQRALGAVFNLVAALVRSLNGHYLLAPLPSCTAKPKFRPCSSGGWFLMSRCPVREGGAIVGSSVTIAGVRVKHRH